MRIIYLFSLLVLLSATGCVLEDEHHHRGGAYDHYYYHHGHEVYPYEYHYDHY